MAYEFKTHKGITPAARRRLGIICRRIRLHGYRISQARVQDGGWHYLQFVIRYARPSWSAMECSECIRIGPRGGTKTLYSHYLGVA